MFCSHSRFYSCIMMISSQKHEILKHKKPPKGSQNAPNSTVFFQKFPEALRESRRDTPPPLSTPMAKPSRLGGKPRGGAGDFYLFTCYFKFYGNHWSVTKIKMVLKCHRFVNERLIHTFLGMNYLLCYAPFKGS